MRCKNVNHVKEKLPSTFISGSGGQLPYYVTSLTSRTPHQIVLVEKALYLIVIPQDQNKNCTRYQVFKYPVHTRKMLQYREQWEEIHFIIQLISILVKYGK